MKLEDLNAKTIVMAEIAHALEEAAYPDTKEWEKGLNPTAFMLLILEFFDKATHKQIEDLYCFVKDLELPGISKKARAKLLLVVSHDMCGIIKGDTYFVPKTSNYKEYGKNDDN